MRQSRTFKLFRHRLGGDSEELFHEPDALFRVSICKTKDDAYIVLYSSSFETTECYTNASDPDAHPVIVQPRVRGLRYEVAHRNGLFYLSTNDNAPNFKVVTAPVAIPAKENWQDLVPHRSDLKLDELDVFAGHMVLLERENGLKTLRIHRFDTDEARSVSFPDPVYTLQGQ